MLRIMSVCVIAVAIAIRVGASTADSAPPPSNGRIMLQGEHITSFTLKGGSGASFADPPNSIEVPCGTYPGATVVLDAGNGRTFTGTVSSFRVVPNEPLVLKVGGPLVQRAKAAASGGFMRLVYQLVDRAGNEYRSASTSHADRPAFAVYKGGLKIAAGRFEYG